MKLPTPGHTPWNGPFRNIELRTDGTRNRRSRFFDPSTWISRSEPGAPITSALCHEEMTTVRWGMKAPQKVGHYREAFAVRVGDDWVTDQSPTWDVAAPT